MEVGNKRRTSNCRSENIAGRCSQIVTQPLAFDDTPSPPSRAFRLVLMQLPFDGLVNSVRDPPPRPVVRRSLEPLVWAETLMDSGLWTSSASTHCLGLNSKPPGRFIASEIRRLGCIVDWRYVAYCPKHLCSSVPSFPFRLCIAPRCSAKPPDPSA